MSVDSLHSDSSIVAEGDRIVWRMSYEVAEQLAMVISDHASRSNDAGWREDAEMLFAATDPGEAPR